MTIAFRYPVLLLALALPALAACQREAQVPRDTDAATASTAASDAPETILGKSVEKALREARAELERGNLDLNKGVDISIGGDHGRHHGFHIGGDKSVTDASITPHGELLIDGKPVVVTPAQRELLLAYRKDIISVAEAGMAIGVKGADLAGKAVLETLSGLMHGDADKAGKRIEAEGHKLEAEAMKICRLLPHMLATQDRLAAALPAFKPYATMTQEDVDDCGKEVRKSVAGGDDATRAEIREEIRDNVRENVRAAARGESSDADGEASRQ
jgi:hypothetical protein